MAVRYSDLSPNPRYSLRFVVGYACACEEEGNCERFCEGGVRDFLSRPIGTYPPNPPSCMARGFVRDLRERFLGFMACSIRSKPSKQLGIQTFKKPCAPPFLVGIAYKERSE